MSTVPPAAVMLAAAATLAAAACSTPCAADGASWTAVPPPRPAECRTVAAGDGLQAAITAAAPGAALCLAPGLHRGPIRVTTPLTLWGTRDAIISGGLTITADDVTVAGLTVESDAVGVEVQKTHRTHLIGNHVLGDRGAGIGERGDSIRLWETDDAVVEDNLIEDGRDVVVWYSRRALLRHNDVRRSRYGAHFMYSHGSRVADNRYVGVTVGVFVMYSRDVELTGNVIANAAGSAGIAIGLKDSGSVRIANNLLVRDEVGIFIDATPQRRDELVEITGNQIRLCRTAIVFHATAHGVRIHGNDFGGNDVQTRVDGGGDALRVGWEGNWFDDYTGYDLDDDGTGDVPYELRSFTGELVARQPELGFMRGTPALAMADAAAHLDPLYQPRTLLVDRAPRMAPVAGQGAR